MGVVGHRVLGASVERGGAGQAQGREEEGEETSEMHGGIGVYGPFNTTWGEDGQRAKW